MLGHACGLPGRVTIRAVARIDELRDEYRRLINSMEYAYAMGHSHTLGSDPRLMAVRSRALELERRIAALSGEGGPDGPARDLPG
jgi:hypothetical protein